MDNFKWLISPLVCGLGLLSIVGCSPAQDPQQNQQKSTVANEAVTVEGDFIQATSLPATNAERQARLAVLSKGSHINAAEQREALMLRYALLTANQKPQQAALEQLLVDVGAAVKQQPEDYELLALRGSATCLETTFFLDDLGKTNLLAKKGSRYLDRAVKKAPNNLGVRMYRGITYAEMPAFLGKGRQAVADLKLLKSQLQAGNDDDFVTMVDYYLAMALVKNQQQNAGLELLGTVVQKKLAPWSERAKTLIKQEG